MRPWAMSIWNRIRSRMTDELESLGVQEAYFPLLISQEALRREEDHLEGFSPEVAWVTRAGDRELAAPLAIRPTSETAIYPAISKWIVSERDLPLRLNQWCNVLRWEFNNPTPLIRGREFLWQEGHSAWSTAEEARIEAMQIIELYRKVYEEYLAVPVTVGKKSQIERFAGAEESFTLEAFIPAAGKAVQAATSHYLGQKFARMFDIAYSRTHGEKEWVWQTSWGFTTRSIGLTIMTHGDDRGLVLPPRVAPTQVVIVPLGITVDTPACVRDQIYSECRHIQQILMKQHQLRVDCDFRENQTPGWKFAHWEQRGVPLRLNIGPRELETGVISGFLRHKLPHMPDAAISIRKDILGSEVEGTLGRIQDELFSEASRQYNDSVVECQDEMRLFTAAIKSGKMALTLWCGLGNCESSLREKFAGVKSLCAPLKHSASMGREQRCFHCGSPAQTKMLFGKSY